MLEDRIPTERLRLNNLSPQPGARKGDKRKGRGYGAGQVSMESSAACMTRPEQSAGALLGAAVLL